MSTFDWDSPRNGAVVTPGFSDVAVYITRDGMVAIRQRDSFGGEQDRVIFMSPFVVQKIANDLIAASEESKELSQ